MNFLKLVLPLIIFAFAQRSQARLLQIIHTNDLHSYFAGYHDGLGGYAKVMTKIKELKAKAATSGIEVLQLDAGDWGEGTSFFLSHDGKNSVKALEMMGTEVAAIGNHDHLLGGANLGKLLRESNVKTKFVAANLAATPEMNLGNTILPFVDLERAGIPIRIVGLTTADPYFQYSMAPGKIDPPNAIGESFAKSGKQAGRKLVIALSHLGVLGDEQLVAGSRSIDVVIGGHTHSKLTSVDWIKNLNGASVPIVQAWGHGLAVGSLLLDVSDSGSVKVVEYKLHEITGPIADDPDMVKFVEETGASRQHNLLFNLDEIIGETKVPMTGYLGGHPVIQASCWGWHMATAAREAANANVGVHYSPFEGVYKNPGHITYADLADNFPHFRKFSDQGWEIVTVLMPAYKLRKFMYWASRRGYGMTFSGLGYKDLGNEDKGYYSVAIPAEVALAIKTSFPQYQFYLEGLKPTGKFYWPVMVDYIRKNSPIHCQ